MSRAEREASAPRLCEMCGITPKGAASERARVSPAGVVHLVYDTGRTSCGKLPSAKWRRP